MNSPSISPDAQVIVLACSALAAKGDRSPKPLTAKEWHDVSLALRDSALERPADLAGLDAKALQDALAIDQVVSGRLAALLSRGGQLAIELERLSSRGIWVLTRADDGYPAVYKQRLRGQAPPLLFGAGLQAHLERDSLAIVGSRDVDEEGLQFARQLGAACSRQDFAVVSGAARGVDAAAMAGVLERGGVAIGITVDPLERLVGRRELRTAIAEEQLTLATPYHPSARWHQGNAMRRNRLIYVMARAAVVVASSPESGGTRSGALENLKADWVPMHVRDDGSVGNAQLISAGGLPLPSQVDPSLTISALVSARRPNLLDPTRAETTAEAPTQDPESSTRAGGGNGARIKGDSQVAGPATMAEVSESPQDGDDAFVLVWPALERQLAAPTTEREVAERLQIRLGQAREWLARAVSEGRADVGGKPKRYKLAGARADQLAITDE